MQRITRPLHLISRGSLIWGAELGSAIPAGHHPPLAPRAPVALAWEVQGSPCCVSSYGKPHPKSHPLCGSQLTTLSQHSQSPSSGYKLAAPGVGWKGGKTQVVCTQVNPQRPCPGYLSGENAGTLGSPQQLPGSDPREPLEAAAAKVAEAFKIPRRPAGAGWGQPGFPAE